MPYLLENLVVDRVDLVDEGANSAAFISLYKRKEQNITMNATEIIAKMKPEHAEVVTAELTRLNEALGTVTKERDTAQASLTLAEEELKKAKQAPSTEPTEEEILKSLPEEARKLVEKANAQRIAAEETVRKAQEAEAHATAVAKAAELKALPVSQEQLIDIVKNSSPEIIALLTTVSGAIEGTVLGEVGKAKPGEVPAGGKDAWAKIEALAETVAKAESITKARAIARVVDEHPELYREYVKGGAN